MLKNFRKEFVGIDNIPETLNEIETLISRDRYNNAFIEDLKTIFPDDTETLEEPLKIVSEVDLKILKSEFPDK